MSPYAATKQMGERIIKDWVKNSNTACTILRYFNPVGAHPSSHIGELSFEHSQTLLPILTQVATKKRDKLTVFGNDYNTRDGTCIRDYIHVVDLARAHVKAFGYKTDSLYNVFNLGLGSGVTVLEIIKTFEQAAGKKVKWEFGARRVGDIEATYSNNKKALNKLNWNPKYTLKDMMLHAWNWQSRKRSSPIICRKTKGPDPHP